MTDQSSYNRPQFIDDELSRVRKLINEQLSSNEEFTDGMLQNIDSQNGKLIRPSLVLLSHQMFGGGFGAGFSQDDLILVAGIIELIHLATLVHDDVIDHAQKRRNQPTANSLFGNNSAVLLGDMILTRVFGLCADLQPKVIKIIAAATAETCQGEIKQNQLADKDHLTEAEYIRIISEKSAALFQCCCHLGALLAGADSNGVGSLKDFGLNTGIAFQITDDLLDIIGDDQKTGKTTGTDADKGKLTLAVIHSRSCLKKTKRPDEQTVSLLKKCGSLEYANDKAKHFAAKAIDSLSGIGDSRAKDALIEMAKFAANRAEHNLRA